jgi:HlyD family secretion protein
MRRVGRRALLTAGALLALGCRPGELNGQRVVPAARQDLVQDVEVTGTLKSLESDQVGPPLSVTELWEFKIVRMIPEGTVVKVGQEVLAFDPSELEKRLHDFESEVASVSEQLAKSRSEAALTVTNDRLDLEDAEAKRRKADLKADKPADLTAEQTMRVSAIEQDLASQEVAFRRARDRAKRSQERSDQAVLASLLQRARGRVEEIQKFIEEMSVKAARAGTVVYKQDWRGEKKKPGDGTWRGETLLEIASLDKMAAQGQVDEVDASKVTVGQRVGLRLEAHPDREYAGVVERVAPLVGTESPESRVKVVSLELKLTQTDALLMRPGMRFRGRIEIARVPGVLQVPLAAVISTAQGPTVRKLQGRSPRAAPVTLGRRSREMVEIKGGLQAGDRVLLGNPPAGGAGKDGTGVRLGAS